MCVVRTYDTMIKDVVGEHANSSGDAHHHIDEALQGILVANRALRVVQVLGGVSMGSLQHDGRREGNQRTYVLRI